MGIFAGKPPANQTMVTVPVLGPDPYATSWAQTLANRISTTMDGRDGQVYLGDRYSHAWHGWFWGSAPQRFVGQASKMIYGSPVANTGGNQKRMLQAVLQDRKALQAWINQQDGSNQ